MKRILSQSIFVMVFFLVGQAHSYVFTDDFEKGFYWASFPITMNKFVTKVSDGVLLSSLVAECEEDWEAAVGMPIWNIPDSAVSSAKYIGNNIRWSSNFAEETGFDPDRTLAVTIRYQSGTYVTRVEIILNENHSDLKTNEDKLRKVILHELGHTFGLGHSTQYSVMRESIGAAANNLTDDDMDGAVAVMEESLWRQSTNYISPYAEKDEIFNCGSVSTGGSDGPWRFIPSLTLGLIFAFLFRRKRAFASR